jgi:hypothetical protein
MILEPSPLALAAMQGTGVTRCVPGPCQVVNDCGRLQTLVNLALCQRPRSSTNPCQVVNDRGRLPTLFDLALRLYVLLILTVAVGKCSSSRLDWCGQDRLCDCVEQGEASACAQALAAMQGTGTMPSLATSRCAKQRRSSLTSISAPSLLPSSSRLITSC